MACLVCIIFVFYFFSQTGATESGIVGGKVSKPHSRPYMASLQIQGRHTCGGILIREDFVLTVAHCKDSQPLTVVLGAHNISKKEESQQLIQVDHYYPHPDYNGGQSNNIMLLKLKNNAKLNKYVKAIGLPKKNGKVLANVNCVVAGWGQTQPGFKKLASPVLKETTEKVQYTYKCKEIWQNHFDTQSMMCTTFKEKGGICQGDSGGPIICNDELQGLTAYTFMCDCNDPNYPHVFTKIHFFLPWIKKTMRT